MMMLNGVQKLFNARTLLSFGIVLSFGLSSTAAPVQSQKAAKKKKTPAELAVKSMKLSNKKLPTKKTTSKTSVNPVPLTSTQTVEMNPKGMKVITASKPSYPALQSYKAQPLISTNTTPKRRTLLQQNSIELEEVNPEAPEKIFSGSLAMVGSRSMVDQKDGTRSENGMVTLGLSARLNKDWGVSASVAGNQDFRDSENISNGVSDTRVSISHSSSDLADWIKGGYSMTGLVPTSKYSTQYQNLQGGFGAAYRFSLTDKVLADGFGLMLGFSGYRLFHAYDTDKSGRVLNQYTATKTLSGSYSYKQLSLSVEFSHISAWTYNGKQRDAYELSEEIAYSVMPNWGISLGHTNSAAWLSPNGQNSNLKLIDPNSSIVYVSTSVGF